MKEPQTLFLSAIRIVLANSKKGHIVQNRKFELKHADLEIIPM